jgi:hypothetical protein
MITVQSQPEQKVSEIKLQPIAECFCVCLSSQLHKGGQDWENCGSRLVWEKQFVRLCLDSKRLVLYT